MKETLQRSITSIPSDPAKNVHVEIGSVLGSTYTTHPQKLGPELGGSTRVDPGLPVTTDTGGVRVTD